MATARNRLDTHARRRDAWRWAGVAAAGCFALALGGFGLALDGFAQHLHPVAVLGATGVPRALGFNLLAFVIPGALAAMLALRARGALAGHAALAARLGWTLALLAALAFVAQGLLPLDLDAPDQARSRLHGAAWAIWEIAFVAATALLALAGARVRRATAALHAAAGVAVLVFASLAGDAMPAALVQRIAFAAWFAWLAWVGWTAVTGDRRTRQAG
ncbi:DUF998 domain-containing protein [Luteimonas sp. MC1828]|nr:DUF998 domain-containing protein [Luteimonas sp. MC1828]